MGFNQSWLPRKRTSGRRKVAPGSTEVHQQSIAGRILNCENVKPVPFVAHWVKNLTNIYENAGSIPGLA